MSRGLMSAYMSVEKRPTELSAEKSVRPRKLSGHDFVCSRCPVCPVDHAVPEGAYLVGLSFRLILRLALEMLPRSIFNEHMISAFEPLEVPTVQEVEG